MPRRLTLLAAALLLAAACTSSGDGTPSPTPTLEVSPTSEATRTPAPATVTTTPTPAPLATFVSGEYALEDIELLVFSVPYNEYFPSDQIPDRLDRVYRGADGQIHIDTVFTREDTGGYPPVISPNPVVASPSGQELATAVCVQGDCGGFTPPSKDAVTALYRSPDGGDTWNREADFLGGIRVLGWMSGEVVLWNLSLPNGDQPPPEQRLRLHPSDTALVPPPGASQLAAAPYLFDSPYGPLWWTANHRSLIDASGDPVTEFPGRSDQQPAGVEFLPDGTAFWTWTGLNRTGATFGALFDADGTQLTPTLQVGYYCCTATPDGRLLVSEVRPLPEWIGDYRDELPTTQDGAPYARPVPGFLDPATGAIEAITDPFLRAAYQDRDQIRILAVLPASEGN